MSGGYLGQVRTTVPRWLRENGYPADKKYHWSRGRKMRDEVARNGLIPIKDNEPKTFCPTGNHTMVQHNPEFLDEHLKPDAEEYFRDRQRQTCFDFMDGVDVKLDMSGNGENPGVEVDLDI